MTAPSSLDHYRLLGRSGLRVSPLALGTMTFGQDWGWGADPCEAKRIFDAYSDRGGNFVDTSVNYTNGASERILGSLVKDKSERTVIATKFTMARDPANVNSGGNHRLNLVRSVETSLRQLDTDRIDLFYLHVWDFTTTPEEVLRALDDLVRSGKILYVGICNTPAWRVAQMQTLADLRGWSPFVALQIGYSLVERTVEHELLPMAQAMGLGVLPWSPLGGGILTGKYSRADLSDDNNANVSATRKGVIASSGHLNEHSLLVADIVGDVAKELGASCSQVALAWTLQNPAVVSPVMGARTLKQAEDNFGALSVAFTDDHLDRLNRASAVPPIFPENFIGRPMGQQLIFGTSTVESRR
ncbi:aldo/keto reductase [Phyllobacterium endophyticum]|uniref:Aldo/keto reductase n=1 Tax=Phyllobacterium endophyticum TaxID=1149773 RepID=A0A2P7AP65_9HYPH|nr:aldo/keto reductase [Phyllobacterium endophyticum]MBB3233657.1 aryl-alcohol dehydrogenase-like predicted oxidoreductase [Phyllobacterium endophyticum]PSH55989.1 aldo/keto reductase [Phyllobacterium endophyticum]TYR41134.1 aldo/keto reductase [Phyllobacterium endophyticum]